MSVKYPNIVDAAHLLPLSLHHDRFITVELSPPLIFLWTDRPDDRPSDGERRDSRDKQKLDGQREKGRANPFLPSSAFRLDGERVKSSVCVRRHMIDPQSHPSLGRSVGAADKNHAVACRQKRGGLVVSSERARPLSGFPLSLRVARRV